MDPLAVSVGHGRSGVAPSRSRGCPPPHVPPKGVCDSDIKPSAALPPPGANRSFERAGML